MRFFVVELNEDLRCLLGADFLRHEDCVWIYYGKESETLPSVYSEILRRTRAEVILNESSDESLIGEKIRSLKHKDESGDVIYIGSGDGYADTECYSSIMEALYMRSTGASDEPDVSWADISSELEGKKSVCAIAIKLSLDPVEMLRTFVTYEKDKKKLYQELLHTFGNKNGLAAYKMIKEAEAGPFRKPAVPDYPEPIIYSDITLDNFREKQGLDVRGPAPLPEGLFDFL